MPGQRLCAQHEPQRVRRKSVGWFGWCSIRHRADAVRNLTNNFTTHLLVVGGIRGDSKQRE